MSYEAILEKLIEIFEEDLDISEVSEDTSFMNDLDFNEEEYETLAKYIREVLDIDVSQDILDDCQTIGDLAAYIEENI